MRYYSLWRSLKHSPRDRRNGALPRCNHEPRPKKLDKLEDEEEALFQQILELGQRGKGATKAMVRIMTNVLLAERYREPVDKHWVDNFKTRTPEIQLQRSHPQD
jgi:hypothetical protein